MKLSIAAAAALAIWIAGGCRMIRMPGRSHSGSLPPLTARETAARDRIEAHVRKLAGEIGERNLDRYDALEEARRYIDRAFRESGYGTAEQVFQVADRSVRNIEAALAGTADGTGVVVIGAHYDTEVGSPGADDNASGVAALLEMARMLGPETLPRTIRFVAFVNEEAPYFQTEAMGSLRYARRASERGEQVAAMFSLESIGYYSDEEGSQQYPFPLRFFYPSTGNFIGFVGNGSSAELVRRAIDAFRRDTAFPSQGIAAPGWVAGVSWSDQWAFWDRGYPALMVTDTAPFRNPHYHRRDDTPETIDYDRMARVVAGLGRVVRRLGGRES